MELDYEFTDPGTQIAAMAQDDDLEELVSANDEDNAEMKNLAEGAAEDEAEQAVLSFADSSKLFETLVAISGAH